MSKQSIASPQGRSKIQQKGFLERNKQGGKLAAGDALGCAENDGIIHSDSRWASPADTSSIKVATRNRATGVTCLERASKAM
jgi:hypothetical protein